MGSGHARAPGRRSRRRDAARLALAAGLLLACCQRGELRATDPDGAAPDAPDARAADGSVPRDAAVPPAAGDAAPDASPTPLDSGAPPPPPPDAGPRPPPTVTATNPVLPGDHPDPHVLRVSAADGSVTYFLVATVDSGDFPVFSSRDLVRWERLPEGLFRRSAAAGSSLAIGEHHYCHLWAPSLVELGPASYMLSFTATRFAAPRSPCPPYGEDSGVYLAWSASPAGPFADAAHPWEPLPVGGQVTTCPADVRSAIPRSVDLASDDCQGTFCHHIVRLDSDAFRDPATGRWWLAYSWYTNSPPLVDWEHGHHGEHVSLVEIDAADPFAVICDPAVAQIHAVDPHDDAMLGALAASCPRCGEMLSMTRGRLDESMVRDGYSWGVAEGASLFRRGGLVYLLASGSAWDSAYYHVLWVAAPSVEELRWDSPTRMVGRYLVPSAGQAFGHGSAVLGPDGESWYFVHHRLRHADCRDRGDCARDVWVSPIEFDAAGRILPRFPAEAPEITVRLP